MSEVSSWNETDNSNTAAPPDGWPEFMNPSDVNNCARAMMGAIKRWYNTVSAGIANAVPLSGGTMTGQLTAPALVSTGSISSALDIYAGRDITAGGNLSVSGAAGISNGVTTNNVHATGNVTADGAVNAATGTVSGLLSTNDIHTNSLTVNANEALTGTLTAGDIHTGGLTVNGNAGVTLGLSVGSFINTVTYQLAGVNFAYRGSDVAGALNTICDPTGFPAIDIYGVNGTYYRCDNAHSFTNRAATVNIVRFQVTDGVCQNASGAWSTFSDAALKENIEPYRSGLAEVLQLEPRSFNYTKDAPLGAGSRRFGLLAQEVAAVLPEIVGETTIDEKTYATIEPGLLVFALVNSIKALEARLTLLEAGG